MRLLILFMLAAAGALAAPARSTPIHLRPGSPPDDAVWRAILDKGRSAPADVFEVRQRLEKLGGELETHIVANRGFHNPEAGSFSFFESYSGPTAHGEVQRGELFLGFFSERQGNTLAVQQSFDAGLMIELIAWDYSKQMFGFWELVGNGSGSEWHYRGDSADVLADLAAIGVASPKPQFGKRLRCSGCHTMGGPILKELEPPHNDWWTASHKLALGSMKLEPGDEPANRKHVAARLFAGAMDAWNLGRLVKLGNARMVAARARRGGDGQDLRQKLRSLFQTMEMNLASDGEPFPERRDGGHIEIPAAFFCDERLTGPEEPVRVPVAVYRQALERAGARFAADEAPGLVETRHAFLVPVRSHVDNVAIDELEKEGVLDAELVADVLAVDFTTPVYSAERASLIRHVPRSGDAQAGLIAACQAAPAQDAAAKALLANLTSAARTAEAHRKAAKAYVARCRERAGEPEAVLDWLKIASQRRLEVAAAETSQNPRGTILEPGFRVIFPTDKLGSKPGRLALGEDGRLR